VKTKYLYKGLFYLKKDESHGFFPKHTNRHNDEARHNCFSKVAIKLLVTTFLQALILSSIWIKKNAGLLVRIDRIRKNYHL